MSSIFSQLISHVLPSNVLGPIESTLADIRRACTDAITAFAGGGQTSATLLTTPINRVTVVATAADSVKLPPAVAGLEVYLINSDAADSMNVYPSTGDTINAIAANSPFAMAAGARNHFLCPVAGKWFTFPLVNS